MIAVLCRLRVGSGVHSCHGRASGVAAFGVLAGLAVVVSLLTEDATRHIRQAAEAAEADRLMTEADRCARRWSRRSARSCGRRASADAAVGCLRSPWVQLTAEHHDQLLATVEESLDQLARVAASLLDMSRQAHSIDGYACQDSWVTRGTYKRRFVTYLRRAVIETQGRFYEAESA